MHEETPPSFLLSAQEEAAAGASNLPVAAPAASQPAVNLDAQAGVAGAELAAEMPAEGIPTEETLFDMPVRTATARMVAYSRGKLVAFAQHATQELIENPQWQHVPGAAYYAYGLLYWQNRYIPFIHLESVLQAYPAFDASAAVHYALVLAYQTAPGEPLQYGAIAVAETPYSHPVQDADFCPLPTDSDMWPALAISCFQYQGQAIPILDAAKIFGGYHG